MQVLKLSDNKGLSKSGGEGNTPNSSNWRTDLLASKRADQILNPRSNCKDLPSARLVRLSKSGGEGSNLRRENPPDLQSGAIGHSATSG